MSNKIFINSTSYEVRIALVEDEHLAEFHLQRPSEKGLVGNIYRGRVVKVLPGMQAAFIDIGLERMGFLYVSDIYVIPSPSNVTHSVNYKQPSDDTHIETLLSEGQDITVQVVKNPIGTKGARLTCHITLACRNLVFMPLTEHIGISRKIQDEEIRMALKERIEILRPGETGFIVRTVAENATMEELEADMEFLLLLWDEIKDTSQKTSNIPRIIYEDLDITFRSVRDLFTEEVHSLTLDDHDTYEKLLGFARTFVPKLQDRIFLYQEAMPLFEAHGIDSAINKALEKKVWLRSGGHIIIETTEALSVIDVNTGKYVGEHDLEETIFKTNMEAVTEIAYQLRLRNIGGIIVIDFIDMEQEKHKEELYRSFLEAVKKDKSRINILKLSEFGIVQMTRKRCYENLSQMMCEPCHHCAGEGVVKSRKTICYEIFRTLSRKTKHNNMNVTLTVHPQIADSLYNEEKTVINQFKTDLGKELNIVCNDNFHIEHYEIDWNT